MGRRIVCRIRARLLFELQRALWHFAVVQLPHDCRLRVNARAVMR